MHKVKLNWIHIFKDHMQKSTRLSDYHYSYAVLISKFLNYFEVDLEDELFETVKSLSEINNGSLSKMGFTKVYGKWISKGGDQAGSSSGAQDEEENEVVATRDELATESFEVEPSVATGDERITSMTLLS